MIRSMTGYGSATGEAEGIKFTVEIKGVNNRYLDVTVRSPRGFLFAEEALKSAVQKNVSRGKVDVFVTVDSSKAGNVVVSVNEPLAEGYIAALGNLSEKYGLKSDLSSAALSRYPDVLTLEKRETDAPVVAGALCKILEEALESFNKMRLREGGSLSADILSRLADLERLTGLVEERSPRIAAEYREKLTQRIREMLEGGAVDEQRILTEAAIFADRVAVDEETVRLRSHISQFRDMLSGGSPIGRKLDFLTQEVNREVNTIGSKGNDAEIARIVVDMKAEAEKIREQVQNIE